MTKKTDLKALVEIALRRIAVQFLKAKPGPVPPCGVAVVGGPESRYDTVGSLKENK